MTSVGQDLRYGWRLLGRSRGFALLAIAMLALGIGAAAAIFSVINAIVLRPLPIRDPAGLEMLAWSAKQRPKTQNHDEYGFCPAARHGRRAGCSFSKPMFRALGPAFAELAAFEPGGGLAVNTGRETTPAQGTYVSGNYFGVVGVRAALGRLLNRRDDQQGATPTAVLSYRYFEHRLGGNAQWLGRTILVNNEPVRLVGVTGRDFNGLNPGIDAQMWMPLATMAQIAPSPWPVEDPGRSLELELLGRGAQRGEAQAIFVRGATAADLAGGKSLFAAAATPRLVLFPAGRGLATLRHALGETLLLLMIAAGLLLLIACLNVAGLLLGRAVARRREIGVRLALGAQPRRIFRQLLTEALWLAGGGVAGGIALAYAGARALAAMLSTADWGGSIDLRVAPDGRVLGFTCALGAATVVVFALAPAWQAARAALAPALKKGVGGSGRRSWSGALVAAQMALAMVVLAGAGLLVQTVRSLESQRIGFDAHHLLLFNLDPSLSGYSQARVAELYPELQEKLATLPGAVAASYAGEPLLAGGTSDDYLYMPGSSRRLDTDILRVSPGYFATLRLPLVAGRDFNSADAPSSPGASPRVAIVNQAFARQFLGAGSPLGKTFRLGDLQAAPTRVIGEAADSKYASMREADAPIVFEPMPARAAVFTVRTAMAPMALLPAVRALVDQLAPGVPLDGARTQEEQIGQTLFRERLLADLATLFAIMALALAAIGLYAVLAGEVARRTREIGIRVALGARRADVVGRVIRQGGSLAAIGAAAGIGVALVATRALGHVLFGVQPSDLPTYAAAAAILGIVALAACWLPASRAMRVEPIVALRDE